MPEKAEIVRKVLSRGYNISPEALKLLAGEEIRSLDSILDRLPDKPVIEIQDVVRIIEGVRKADTGIGVGSRGEDGAVSILHAPRDLGIKGTPEEFVNLIRTRFERLKSILARKSGRDPIPISSLLGSTARNGDSILVIGMVMEKRLMRDSSIRMVLDDETGSIPVIFKRGSRYWDHADRVPVDSVIAVKGVYTNGKIYADSFRVPDLDGELVPPGSGDGKVVFMSDTHIGSRYFNEEAFERFIRWLNSDSGREIRYLIICGDLVDGIGVYPGQEEELKVADVYRQFELAARFLERIPRGIKIVYIPGNHEPVRQAEPQPVVPDEYLDELLSVRDDLMALPNPSMIGIGDVRVLIYHGRSLNTIFKHIPGLQPIRPETVVEAMIWMLRLRHLAPIYGEHPISPEGEDWLLLNTVPHVLHTGHIHVYGVGGYKGVKLINSGTFENETPYIKSLGIEVTVGRVPILDLASLEVEVKEFV